MSKGRGHDRTGRSEKGQRYIKLEYSLLEEPGYLALSSNAKVVMQYMAKLYNGRNNGHIAFGVRSGCYVRVNGQNFVNKDIGLSRFQTGRALHELEKAGFTVCTKESKFGQKKLQQEWRLTWLPSGACNEHPATDDYKNISPPPKPPRKQREKQNPGALVHMIPPLQEHQCTYLCDPISPFELYRSTGAPRAGVLRSTGAHHILTRGTGSEEGEAVAA